VEGADDAALDAETVRVPCVTLDSCARAWPDRPTFIKIDAESAESHVFAGMDETLERLRPVVAFEVGDFEIENVPRSRELIVELGRRGYAAYRIRGGRLEPHAIQDRYRPETIVSVPPGQTVLPEIP
jgi:hypothetical protein